MHSIFRYVPIVVALLIAAPAAADVKIAFIDPLSGGAATTGILAQKTHQFYIDAINGAGGINGEKIELISFDNKVNPQESLIQLKKALDEGARYVVQGNGSSIAHAITDAVQNAKMHVRENSSGNNHRLRISGRSFAHWIALCNANEAGRSARITAVAAAACPD